jgi:hypothetical protein
MFLLRKPAILLFNLFLYTAFAQYKHHYSFESNKILSGPTRLFGTVYGNTKLSSEKIYNIIRKNVDAVKIRYLTNSSPVLHDTTDHNFRKQFARSKLARGSALSSKCNSRCAVKTPCNKRCQLARDAYQLQLAKTKYKKDKVTKYTSTQLNQRYYSSQVSSGACNSRCKAAKDRYQKQRTQYMKAFHRPCQNGHIKNTGTYDGKPLSDQGNPSGNTPGDKTSIGSYGGASAGRPLGAPGAGQINWPNYAKYNWRTACTKN